MRVFLVLGAAACGAAQPSVAVSTSSDPPPGDEVGFRKLLVDDVRSGGLWFPDTGCQAQFGRFGTIKPDAFDAFARCVSTLHLRPTGRAHWFEGTSVLTDDAGFEIEARVAGGKLEFIGPSGRAPGMPDLPSITNQTLESLRSSGDPHATLTDDEASRVVSKGSPDPIHTEYLRLCVDEQGQVTHLLPGKTTTPESAAAFSALARTWKFREFVVEGKPMAACAIAAFQYPAIPRTPPRLPRPPQLSKAGNFIYTVKPAELEKLRISGDKLLVPDDVDKVRLSGKRISGSFKLCVDETGRYESGELMKSTGVPRYDAKIARAMMAWAYRPYVVDGIAIPVCSVTTFIYSQR